MFSLRNSIHKNVGLFIRFWMFTADYCKPLTRGPTECACSTICSTGYWMAIFYDSFPLNMQRYQPFPCCVYINPKFLMVLNRSFDGHSKSRVNRPSNSLEPPSFNLSNQCFFFLVSDEFSPAHLRKHQLKRHESFKHPRFFPATRCFQGYINHFNPGFSQPFPDFTVSKPRFQTF